MTLWLIVTCTCVLFGQQRESVCFKFELVEIVKKEKDIMLSENKEQGVNICVWENSLEGYIKVINDIWLWGWGAR